MTPLHDTQNESVGSTESKEGGGKKKNSRTPFFRSYQGDIGCEEKKKEEVDKKKNSIQSPSPSPLRSQVQCDSGWQSEHSSCATAMYKNTAKRQNIGVSLFKSSGWTERQGRGGGLENVSATVTEKSSWNKKQLKEHSFPHYPSEVPAS